MPRPAASDPCSFPPRRQSLRTDCPHIIQSSPSALRVACRRVRGRPHQRHQPPLASLHIRPPTRPHAPQRAGAPRARRPRRRHARGQPVRLRRRLRRRWRLRVALREPAAGGVEHGRAPAAASPPALGGPGDDAPAPAGDGSSADELLGALSHKVALLERELTTAHALLLQARAGDATSRRLWELACRASDLTLLFDLRVSGPSEGGVTGAGAAEACCAKLESSPRVQRPPPPSCTVLDAPSTPPPAAGQHHVGVTGVRAPAGLPAVR